MADFPRCIACNDSALLRVNHVNDDFAMKKADMCVVQKRLSPTTNFHWKRFEKP